MPRLPLFRAAVGIALMLLCPARVDADWMATAFAGVTFASSHGFVDLEQASGHSRGVIGGGAGWHHDPFTIEIELAVAPGFFKGRGDLVETGTLSTFMANLLWHLRPGTVRLRPYVGGGLGIARVAIDDTLGAFTSRSTLGAANLAGGVSWRATAHIEGFGELTYVRTQYGDQNAAGLGEEFVAFARAVAGLRFRTR
jgi:hypothetical protein